MSTRDSVNLLLASLILSVGIAGAGALAGKAFIKSKLANRVVTVKGIAEKDVEADLGLWEINYKEIGGDLVELNKRMLLDQQKVITFLQKNGFNNAEIFLQPSRLEDKIANAYQNTADSNLNQRYILTGGVRVRSNQVSKIEKVNEQASQLMQEGVALSFDSGSYGTNPRYYYTKLDTIRPSMLAESTRSARLVAEQFAKDSDTELNGILRANQGMFQIMDRDSSSIESSNAVGTINKKIRLVTTIDYRLK